jgi:hypothetical protein
MLARFCFLPVLLFVLLPFAALAGESPKEKPTLQEPPITIVSTAIVPATVFRGIIHGKSLLLESDKTGALPAPA